MKPFVQVAHVMTKDVRQLRWPLAAYVALVALATAHTILWPSIRNELFDSIMLLVVMLGMIVVALLVQTDSPIRADAYWASRPLAPWAVLGAKIAGALLLVLGLALVGQYLGLRAFDLSPRLIPGELAASARTYALCLIVAMVLAALTQDFRSFVVALVTVPITLLVLGATVLSAIDISMRSPSAWLLTGVAMIGGAALLVTVYRTRYSRAPIWLPGFIVAWCGMFAVFASPAGPSSLEHAGPQLAEAAPLTLQINSVAQLGFDSRGLPLTVSVAPTSETRGLLLGAPHVTLHLQDGGAITAPVDMPMIDLYSPRPLLGQGVSWIGGAPPVPASRSFTARLDDAQQRNVRDASVSSVDLDGQMVVSESHVVGSVPLQAGARMTRNGTRVAIQSWSESPRGPVVTVRVSTVTGDQPSPGWSMFAVNAGSREFALVNPARREAVVLVSRSMSGGGGPLVLPGSSATNALMTLSPLESRTSPTPGAAVDDDWLRGAQLVVVRWMSVGQYPVHVTAQVSGNPSIR